MKWSGLTVVDVVSLFAAMLARNLDCREGPDRLTVVDCLTL